MLDDESSTSANLENDHGFINKVDNIIPLWTVVFV